MFAARPVLQMTDAETPGDLSEVSWLVIELRCLSGRRGRGGFVPRTSRFNANGLTRLHRLRGPFPGALAALAASAMPQGLSPAPGLAELLKTTCAASGVAGRRVRGMRASGVAGRRARRPAMLHAWLRRRRAPPPTAEERTVLVCFWPDSSESVS